MRFEPFVRNRLIERIQKASQYRVTLIAASAGFGKSTLLRQFLADYPRSHIRFDVRSEHGTLLSFVRGFTEALEPIVPHLRSSFATAYESARQATNAADALAEWVHENIKDIDLSIVIDDFQHVESQADVLHFIHSLIERSTGFQRWIVSTRTASVFPVALWWERGSMALPIEETELQFTVEEAHQVAQRRGIDTISDAITPLWELTAGWPMAFLLGLSIEGGLEGTSALAMQGRTREIVYRSLAKRAFSQVSEKAQRFMLETCKFPKIDTDALAKAHVGVEDGVLKEIERMGTFFERIGMDTYRYPDLFRQFLEDVLAEIGQNAVQRALLRAARALEANDEFSAALSGYVEAGSASDILRLLESHGFELIESGNSDAIESAANLLGETGESEQPVVLGLRAVIESSRGRYDISDAWFRVAIDRATADALRVELSNRFAEAMLHRYRSDCVALLEPYVDHPGLLPEQRSRIYSTLSTAYVLGQRFGDALLLMHRALNVVGEPGTSARLSASVYQQAAWISLFTGDIPNAKRYGSMSVQIAEDVRLYEVSARAHSVMYSIDIDVEDDPKAAMQHLRAIADCGLKSGSYALRQYALFAMYDIEAENGATPLLEQLERRLDMFEFSYGDRMSLDSLIPSRAMRIAASGDFQQAFELIAGTPDRQLTDDRKAQRWSDVAVYAAASGHDVEATAALDAVALYVDDLDKTSKRTIRTNLNVVLALLMQGKTERAATLMIELRETARQSSQRTAALIEAIGAIVENWSGGRNYDRLLAALRELRAHYMGGIAAFLEALPRTTASAL